MGHWFSAWAAALTTASLAPAALAHAAGSSCAPSPAMIPWRPVEATPFVACFDASDAELVEQVLATVGAQPPTWRPPLLARVAFDTFSWRDEATVSLAGRAQRANLTYSFPPDGIVWGLTTVDVPGGSTGPNDLAARFEQIFGPGNADLGREYIRQSLAAWSSIGGVTYTEVADDGAPTTEDTARSALRGDIRIGGVSLGVNGVLGYNAFPSPNGEIGIGGGDMLINTSYFDTVTFNNPGNDYRSFRNTVTHEHGHGLGLIHVVPCDGTKLMEPFILSFLEGVQVDDIRSIARMNGDRYAGNVSPGAAANLGNLTTPVVRSVLERDLSTNGVSGFGNTDEDYFRFTIDSVQDVVIRVTPTGGVYENQRQGFGCIVDDADLVDATRAGNLRLELRNSAGTSVLASAVSAPAGSPETLTLPGLAAGTYVVKVFDPGPNPAINQITQTYDLEIRVGTATASPMAVAGVDKRVAAGTTAFFIGDLNSRAAEKGATLATYDWDLDGDGVFEIAGDPRPSVSYVSNGDFEATLRVVDSFGQADEDSITVTVFGATTTVAAVAPSIGSAGSVVPVVITGTDLFGVDSASDVVVSGDGVSVVGSPVVDAMGSEITGLSFVIDAGASLGDRSITVQTASGPGVGDGLFLVSEGVEPRPADLDGSGVVDAADLAQLIGAWGVCGTCAEDLDGDGAVGPADLAALVGDWGP